MRTNLTLSAAAPIVFRPILDGVDKHQQRRHDYRMANVQARAALVEAGVTALATMATGYWNHRQSTAQIDADLQRALAEYARDVARNNNDTHIRLAEIDAGDRREQRQHEERARFYELYVQGRISGEQLGPLLASCKG